jgi:hypothetical protein
MSNNAGHRLDFWARFDRLKADAFGEGLEAASKGLKDIENPYNQSDLLWGYWMDGYCKGKKQ